MSDISFHFSDGSKAETLKELVSILRNVNSGVTARHVTPERNDYAQWILHVHNDKALSEQVQKCRTPQEVADVIEEKVSPKQKSSTLTPLKEKLRAVAPKPTPVTNTVASSETARQPPTPHQEPPHKHSTPHTSPPSSGLTQKPAVAFEKTQDSSKHQDAPPAWNPSTPLPKRGVVSIKNNPHVRDFAVGLGIGILIGVLAYGLILQVV